MVRSPQNVAITRVQSQIHGKHSSNTGEPKPFADHLIVDSDLQSAIIFSEDSTCHFPFCVYDSYSAPAIMW